MTRDLWQIPLGLLLSGVDGGGMDISNLSLKMIWSLALGSSEQAVLEVQCARMIGGLIVTICGIS
jgi:hypothetical protein